MSKPSLTPSTVHSPRLRRFVEQQLHADGIGHRRMFGCPAFFTGKRMFACVYGSTVGLKLPAARVRQLLRTPGFEPFTPYGKPMMRQWVAINRPTDPSIPTAALLSESQRFVGAGA